MEYIDKIIGYIMAMDQDKLAMIGLAVYGILSDIIGESKSESNSVPRFILSLIKKFITSAARNGGK
jgi:hypothetical protein